MLPSSDQVLYRDCRACGGKLAEGCPNWDKESQEHPRKGGGTRMYATCGIRPHVNPHPPHHHHIDPLRQLAESTPCRWCSDGVFGTPHNSEIADACNEQAHYWTRPPCTGIPLPSAYLIYSIYRLVAIVGKQQEPSASLRYFQIGRMRRFFVAWDQTSSVLSLDKSSRAHTPVESR
jgi:hypothetical protein